MILRREELIIVRREPPHEFSTESSRKICPAEPVLRLRPLQRQGTAYPKLPGGRRADRRVASAAPSPRVRLHFERGHLRSAPGLSQQLGGCLSPHEQARRRDAS